MAEREAIVLKVGVMLLTGLYLIVELAFNARMLDLAGGMVSDRELHGIELFGRTISGIGCGLLLWSGAQKWGVPSFGKFAGIMLLSVPCIFILQKSLVDELIARASPEKMQLAVYLSVLSHSVLANAVAIEGTGIQAEDYASPAGKVFFALLPFAGSASSGLSGKLKTALPTIVTHDIEREIGTPEQLFNTLYLPFTNTWRRIYNDQYLPLSQTIAFNEGDQDRIAEQAWDSYLQELDAHHILAVSAPERVRQQVVDTLHARKIMVESDWRLDDFKSFKRAMAAKRMTPVTFNRSISRSLGFASTIAPGLSWEGFSNHPDILKRARQELAQKEPSVYIPGGLDLNWNVDQFKSQYYAPSMQRLREVKLASLDGIAHRYTQDVQARTMVDKAMKAVVVPPIALGFSLFFGMLNLVGFIMSLLHLQRMPAFIVRAMFIGLLLWVPLQVNNKVSDSNFFAYLSANVAQEEGRAAAIGLRWVVNAEPLFYPMTHGVNQYLLGNFKFSA